MQLAKYCLANSNPSPRLEPVIKALGIALSLPDRFAGQFLVRRHALLSERSFDAAGQGSLALNHKLIEIAQRNVNSGITPAKSLAAAKTLAEVVEV
jgi:hypothetical protein